MIKKILETIKETQATQDRDGQDHPEQTMVFTFPCTGMIKFMLQIRRIKGLAFERYNDEWYGIYRAHK